MPKFKTFLKNIIPSAGIAMLTTILATMLQHTPEEVTSNISKWADLIHLHVSHVPQWMSSPRAPHNVYVVGMTLAAVVALRQWIYSFVRGKKSSDPIYDTPVREAIVYIAHKILKDGNYCEAARSLIRQEALNGNLVLWGKKQIDPPERFKNSQEVSRRFSKVISVIPRDYWRVSVLSAGALATEYANVPFTQEENAGDWPKASNAYSDIFVNWQQIQDLTHEKEQ